AQHRTPEDCRAATALGALRGSRHTPSSDGRWLRGGRRPWHGDGSVRVGDPDGRGGPLCGPRRDGPLMASREDSKRAGLAALLGNRALAVLKGIAAAATGSAALIAETLHSVADTGNEVLLSVGLRAARRPPDQRHPFGHGKAVYFWSFVVSVLLFTLGGGFAI